ncbi:unnamed protein product [Sphagnum tenellum]
MSVITFVKNLDAFLYNSLADAVLDEFNRVMNFDCQRQHTIAKMSFWMQHKDPGAITWLIGEGIFGTSAGEVVYHTGALISKFEAVRLKAASKPYRSTWLMM